MFFDIAVGTPPAEAYCAVNSVPFHARAHIRDRRRKNLFIRFVINDCKFITADAVSFACKGLLDMGCGTAQQFVALLVSKQVVYLFQAVYIKICYPDGGIIVMVCFHFRIETVAVVQAGHRIGKAEPLHLCGLFLNLCFLHRDLFLKVFAGDTRHRVWKADIIALHVGIGVGNMDMAAFGSIARKTDHGGDTLMHPECYPGGGRGPDPHHAGTDIDIRRDADRVVLLV